MIADIDDGVLVQSVQGLHSGVNPISGDFSAGAAGLLISNGQLGGPVREFTIGSTLQRMLLDVVEVGNDVDWLPMRAAGVSLVIRDVTMSGASADRACPPPGGRRPPSAPRRAVSGRVGPSRPAQPHDVER